MAEKQPGEDQVGGTDREWDTSHVVAHELDPRADAPPRVLKEALGAVETDDSLGLGDLDNDLAAVARAAAQVERQPGAPRCRTLQEIARSRVEDTSDERQRDRCPRDCSRPLRARSSRRGGARRPGDRGLVASPPDEHE